MKTMVEIFFIIVELETDESVKLLDKDDINILIDLPDEEMDFLYSISLVTLTNFLKKRNKILAEVVPEF